LLKYKIRSYFPLCALSFILTKIRIKDNATIGAKKKKMTLSEENYLKAIYHLTVVSNRCKHNAIAEMMETKASSVTDMLKKLAEKI
jgi:DNA-binding MarR family transcriptional regulator